MEQNVSVHAALRHRLISGGFDHGAKLRPDDLKDEFGCSASTVREALFRLSTAGLVDFQEQRGFRVPVQNRTRQHDLTHMRIMLETEGACLSIRLGDLDWESRLSAAHHKLSHIETRIRTSGEILPHVDLWSRAEQAFHETLIDACGSDLLKSMHQMVYAQFRQQLVSQVAMFGYFPENIQEHQSILDAALDRDEAAVRQRIHDHLKRNLLHPLPLAATPAVQDTASPRLSSM